MHELVRATLGLVALSLLSRPVLADDCARPDLLEAYPDYSDVPPLIPNNATLTAHYVPTAQYLGEDVTLEDETGVLGALAATFDETQGLLRVTPGGLLPDHEYTIHWPRLAGIGTASRGRGRDVNFFVSPDPDVEAPSFDGLRRMEWDVRREDDECTGTLEDRFAFELFPDVVTDDFPNELLALYVFQTAGPAIDPTTAAPPVSIQKLPPAGKQARVFLSVDDGGGEVCFAALVKDLAGAPSGGAEREVCARTRKPPFFYGCRMSAPRSRDSRTPFVWVALFGLSFARARRQRRLP